MAGKLKREIKQKRPFSSVQEDVMLALTRTADQLSGAIAPLLRDAGLSLSQYNVLRILRGAKSELPCGEISDRMVRRDPDLTRLLDRLEKHGMVSRARATADRRVVLTKITPEGLRRLEVLGGPITTRVKESLAHVPESKLKTLLDLLEEIRG